MKAKKTKKLKVANLVARNKKNSLIKETKNKKEKNENWLNPRVFLTLAAVFLIAEVLGLMTANALIVQNLAQPMFGEDINDIANAFKGKY